MGELDDILDCELAAVQIRGAVIVTVNLKKTDFKEPVLQRVVTWPFSTFVWTSICDGSCVT